jgi:hypothetical protein
MNPPTFAPPDADTDRPGHAWLMEVISAAREAARSLDEGRYQDAVDRTLAASNAAGAALRVILAIEARK